MYNLREITEKSNISTSFNGRILFDEKIAPKTSFKIGGNAPIFAEPKDDSSLIKILEFSRENKIPYFILGGGTNIVVSDEGFDGIVISTSALNSISIERKEGNSVFVSASSGTAMSRLVSFCTENCLSGIEGFAGLPGSVGGALFMNARCFELSVSDVLEKAEYVNPQLKIEQYDFCRDDWGYKISPLSHGQIITKGLFKLNQESSDKKDEISQKCAGFIKQRLEKGHFKFPSAGSVFKNNHEFGEPAGKIIDSLGLKGYSIGGAQISPWHGNIIINRNKATQSDVLALVNFVREKVFAEKGFYLESEIIFCGKDASTSFV